MKTILSMIPFSITDKWETVFEVKIKGKELRTKKYVRKVYPTGKDYDWYLITKKYFENNDKGCTLVSIKLDGKLENYYQKNKKQIEILIKQSLKIKKDMLEYIRNKMMTEINRNIVKSGLEKDMKPLTVALVSIYSKISLPNEMNKFLKQLK